VTLLPTPDTSIPKVTRRDPPVAVGAQVAELAAAGREARVALAARAVARARNAVGPAGEAVGAAVAGEAGELGLALALARVLGAVACGAFARALAPGAGVGGVERCAEGPVVAQGALLAVDAFGVVLEIIKCY